MPALKAQRSSAMMLNKIRRELERRRKSINVANGGVVKKSSAAPPPPRLIPSMSGPGAPALKKSSASLPHPRVRIPVATPGAATNKIAYLEMGEAPKRRTAPPRREALIPFAMKVSKSSAPTVLIPHAAMKLSTATSHETTGAEAECIKKPSFAPFQQLSSSMSVKKGMTVKVRAPARTLSTGQRIVIVHPAVVVSDLEDGYLDVIYSGYPRDRTVRIALDQVKKKNSASQPTTAVW